MIELPDHPLVKKARELAEEWHAGQLRKYTGEGYITHPIRVATIVYDALKGDPRYPIYVAAALLHDVIEDTTIKLDAFGVFDTIEADSTQKILSIVLDLTNNKTLKGTRKWRKFAMANQIKNAQPISQLIKLADRLDNLQDLQASNPQFVKEAYGKESLDLLDVTETLNVSIYAPQYTIFSREIKNIIMGILSDN